MSRIRTVIVDDEPHARRTLRALLARDPACDVVGEACSGEGALRIITESEPDLVFLDIEMPGINGFQVLEQIARDEGPLIVFVTAYDEYAIRAFEVNAVDYVLKPFDDERFMLALGRAKERIRTANWGDIRQQFETLMRQYAPDLGKPNRPSPPSANTDLGEAAGGERGSDGYLRRIAVKRYGAIILVDVHAIDWIEAANYYVRLHVGSTVHLVRESMTRLEAQLDPQQFVRVHRSVIVRIDRIKELKPYSHGDYLVLLRDGTEVRMSRNRRAAVREPLGLAGDAP